jgi:hypothetical protein
MMNNGKTMNPDTVKHLEFIQNAINRMAANSFQMKGWSITIFSALFALFAANGGNACIYLFVSVIQSILFWFLDTYYLQQERKFRGIYSDVAELSVESEKIEVRPFEMPIQKYQDGRYSFCSVMWSRTVCPIYLTMIAGSILVGILLK